MRVLLVAWEERRAAPAFAFCRGRSLGCPFTLRGGLRNPGGNAFLDRGPFLDQIWE